MIPSIDYLTCVLSGSILLAGAANLLNDEHDRSGFVLVILGVFIFTIGTIRAVVSAMGI